MKVLDQLVFFGQLHGVAAELRASAPVTGPSAWRSVTGSIQQNARNCRRACSRRFSSSPHCCTIRGLVVMDEPFTGLDPVNTYSVAGCPAGTEIRGARRSSFQPTGWTRWRSCAIRSASSNGGQAVLSGKVREIKSRYERNRVIVEFEGSAEFLKSPGDRRGQQLLRSRRDRAEAPRRRAEALARGCRGMADDLSF